jgi:hypothetical protein
LKKVGARKNWNQAMKVRNTLLLLGKIEGFDILMHHQDIG